MLELDAKSDRVQDALVFARRNLHEPLSVERLAEAARLSPRQNPFETALMKEVSAGRLDHYLGKKLIQREAPQAQAKAPQAQAKGRKAA